MTTYDRREVAAIDNIEIADECAVGEAIARLKAEIERLTAERDEALDSNASWQETWRVARGERDAALKDSHARMLACEALGVTLDSERKAWEAERASLQEALRSIASHGTTRPWAPGTWDDGDGYWRQVTHALIAAAADALGEQREGAPAPNGACPACGRRPVRVERIPRPPMEVEEANG